MLPQLQFLNLPQIDASIQQQKAAELQNALAPYVMQKYQMEAEKGGMEMQLYRDKIEREKRIRDSLQKLAMGGTEEQPASAPVQAPAQMPASAMPGGEMSPKTGGPDWLQAYQAKEPQPTVSAVPAPTQPKSTGKQDLAQRFFKQAEIYAMNGDADTANKLYEHAAKFMPEVSKIEVAMDNGKPVNVIYFKDGTQQVSGYAPTPKVHWADNGQRIQAVNEYTLENLGAGIQKQATPGEVLTDARTRSEGAANRAVTMRGQNLTDARAKEANALSVLSQPFEVAGADGTPILVQQDKRTSKLIPVEGFGPKGKDGTEGEKTAAGYYSRMATAENILNDIATKDKNAQKPGFIEQTLPEGVIANSSRSDNRQQYRQAQEDWVRAKLRKESGAVIGEEEMAREISMYFPQKGDSDAVIAQKARARQIATDAMKQSGGRAVKEPATAVGKPKTGDIVDGFRFLGGDPADQKRWMKVGQ